jgi:predicted DNA-binding transcriptional regulator YafY
MVNIRLKIESKGAYRVLDDFDEKYYSKNEDGSFIVQTRLPDGDWLINYILSYGSVAEVLEPESIRELVRESLKNTLKKYDKVI